LRKAGIKKNNLPNRQNEETEKKIREDIQLLEENNTIFMEMVEVASVGMMLVSLEGNILFTNDELCRNFGYTKKEVTGQNIEIIFCDNNEFNFFTWYEKSSSVKKASPYKQKNRFLRKDNSHFWGILCVTPIYDNQSKMNYVIVQVQDITSFKLDEDKIVDEYKLLTQLIDNVPANVYIKDVKSRFIFANKWVANIMGVKDPKKLVGKTDFNFFPETMAHKFYADEQEIMYTGVPKINIEEKVMVDDSGKRVRWYSTTKIPYRDKSGEIIGIMGVGMDITKLKREQESLRKAKQIAVKADRLKSAFLTNLSHEIRTPLNGILGFSQVMRQKNVSSVQVDQYLDIILSNGRQLLDLINDIIDISKIDAGDVQLSCQNFSLNILFQQIQKEFTEELKKKHNQQVRLRMELGASSDEDYIIADNFRLRQVITNLLSNAKKFTKKGEIIFGYSFSGDDITCFVTDTGIGIPLNKQKSVFERFVQVDGSHTRLYGGAGLGLSICKGLVELMGGKMWLESTPGKGTTFYFTVPYLKAFGESMG
jgi:two-component system, sensor histidine kinase and response regulator